MEENSFRQVELVHTDPSGKVRFFRCWDPQRKKVLSLKEQSCSSISEFNILLKEGITLTSLAHPAILRLYECFLKQDEDQLKCVFVTEWMDRTLRQEVERRGDGGWGELTLLEMVYMMVDALAYAQEKGIAHRNIHPEGIFITQSGGVAIGDFGFSVRNLETECVRADHQAICFLPPSIRAKIAHMSSDPLIVNPFRCDVYSLGVVFLYMAKLQLPEYLLTTDSLRVDLEADIESVPFSGKVKGLLRSMLSFDDETRPDFLELRRNFREITGFGPTEEALALESRKSVFKKCLICNKRIVIRAGFDDLSIVPLNCNPKSHIFCSVFCFKNYIRAATCDFRLDLGSVLCPKKKCKVPIYPEFSCGAVFSTTKPSESLCEKSKFRPELTKATLCAQCSATVPISDSKQSPAIRLQCSKSHLFCGKICFLDYIRTATDDFLNIDQCLAECPLCQTVISKDFLIEAVGGGQKYERLVAVSKGNWSGCNDCTENQVQVQLKCGHGFCKLCIRSRYEIYRIQGKKNWVCPVCREPIQGEDSLVSFCEVF